MHELIESKNWQARASLFLGTHLHIIVLLFCFRLIIDTSVRMVYPFIPQISEGIGIGVAGFSWMLLIRSWMGLSGPLFGVWADRYGHKRIMLFGMICLSIGSFGMAVLSGWWTIVPIFLTGIGSTCFVPTQQAYVSEVTPFERRGRALATVDMAFAIAGVIGLPMVGWLIARLGWQMPFLVLGVLGLLAAVALQLGLAEVNEHQSDNIDLRSLLGALRVPNVAAAVLVGFLIFLGYGTFISIWGIWLSADFQLDVVAIGFVATLIALAEWAGVLITGLFIDRIGKLRGSLIGLALATALMLLLPLSGSQLVTAQAVLILIGAVCEYTIVALFSLFSEQYPQARATMFSLVSFGVSLGLGAASPLAVYLWSWGGLSAVCILAACLFMLALVVSKVWLRDGAVG